MYFAHAAAIIGIMLCPSSTAREASLDATSTPGALGQRVLPSQGRYHSVVAGSSMHNLKSAQASASSGPPERVMAGSGEGPALAIAPTPFVLREGRMRQVLVRILLGPKDVPMSGVIRVAVDGHETTREVNPDEYGSGGWRLEAPEPAQPATLRVRFRPENGNRIEAQCELRPVKPWTFYMTPHTHYDIGFTAPQPEVIERLAREMNDAVRLCEETASWPEESRYRWTVEVSSLADHFAERHPDQLGRFLELVRDRRIEIAAYYLNMPTELTGHEETIRCLYPAEVWRRKYGVPIDTAMIDDVPGYTWILADLLVNAGVPRVSFRANSIRGQFLWDRVGAVPRPFYWQGPAGKRLFVWYTDSYREGNFFREPGLHEDAFLGIIKRNEATGTEVTDIQLRMGGDNLPPDLDASTNARAWNAKYMWPRVRVATNREFLTNLEAKYGRKAPVVSGDIPSWWADGPASSAAETGINRLTHDRLVSVEALWTLATLYAPGADYPRGRIQQAYDRMIHFDEHTWGASSSISDPHGDATRVQWTWKANQARQAATLVADLEEQAVGILAACVPVSPGDCVAVWNATGDVGRGLVSLRKTDGFPVSSRITHIVDIRGSLVTPAQWDPEAETLYFLAQDVPAFGYAVYRLEARAPSVPSGTSDVNLLENKHYKLAFSPETGAWVSFFDKRLNRDLFDAAAEQTGNHFLRMVPQGGRKAIDEKKPVRFDCTVSGSCRLMARQTGPVFQSLTFETSLPGCPHILQTYRLFEDWLDIENLVDKEEVLEPESIAIAFPFHARAPSFRVQIADAVMRPGLDQLPFSCQDFYSIQHWATVASDDIGVLWIPMEAPLISLGEFNMYRWADRLTFDRGHIYSLIMNNCWTTNFRAGQEGQIPFRYRLATYRGDLSPTAATALARQPFRPMLPFRPAGPATKSAANGGLISIQGTPITISCLKRAESSDALIVRLLELDGNAGLRTLHFSLPTGLRIKEAYTTTPTEARLSNLPVEGHTVCVDVGAHAITTLGLLVE